MFRRKTSPLTQFKRAFTLIEVLTVVAIIGLISLVIIGLQPNNPHGLDDACRLAAQQFQAAQAQAVLGHNPDRDPESNKRYNIRTAVLVLNNEEDEERHLRYIVPIIGGTDDESKTDIRDYYWYAVNGNAGTMLPKGVYFVPPTESTVTSSEIAPLEGDNEVTLDPTLEPGGKRFGTGKQKWYAYYFDSNGQTYMTKATFMVSEGVWMPGTGIRFDRDASVVGFAVTRNGAVIFTRDADETEAANDL